MAWRRPTADELPIDRSALMIDAAVQGLGAALARSGLVEQDLKEGRLVRPMAGEVDAGAGYHLVWRADSRKLEPHRARYGPGWTPRLPASGNRQFPLSSDWGSAPAGR